MRQRREEKETPKEPLAASPSPSWGGRVGDKVVLWTRYVFCWETQNKAEGIRPISSPRAQGGSEEPLGLDLSRSRHLRARVTARVQDRS